MELLLRDTLLKNGWKNEFGGWIMPNKKSLDDFGVRFSSEQRIFDPPIYDFETACELDITICEFRKSTIINKVCVACKGAGKLLISDCDWCDGTGLPCTNVQV